MALGKSTKFLNSNREFKVGDRVAERPTRPFVTKFNTSFNAQPSKIGTIIELVVREQKFRKASAANRKPSRRRYAIVQWDIRTRPDEVAETRLVHENELSMHEELTRLEA